jgi:hypothetical protein
MDSGSRLLIDKDSKRTKKNTITATKGLMIKAIARFMGFIITQMRDK